MRQCLLVLTVLTIIAVITTAMHPPVYTLLSLGDSYTIGEAVEEKERFPNQAVALLQQQGYHFKAPQIIAKTGWTTDELAEAIKAHHLNGTYNFVTLLIGVNNQYRNRPLDNYRQEFRQLLHTAIQYAGGNAAHVIVVSIPDWGVTPFALNDSRGPDEIGRQIDAFNAINREEAQLHKVHYADITPDSKLAKTNPELIAGDGLHPSGKMYAGWAQKVAAEIAAQLEK